MITIKQFELKCDGFQSKYHGRYYIFRQIGDWEWLYLWRDMKWRPVCTENGKSAFYLTKKTAKKALAKFRKRKKK